MSPNHEHQPFLPKGGVSIEANSPHHIPRRSANRAILSNIIVFLLTSLLWLAIGIFTSPTSNHPGTTTDQLRHNITTNARLLTCGTTPTEARALNCKYDIFLNNWVPLPCYDAEWIVEYQEDNSWGAFADENLTVRLTPEEMEEREFYYTSLRDHVNHCGMMWNKQFWALFEERRAVDTVVASARHTEHCARFLMDVGLERVAGKGKGLGEVELTRTEVGFAGCWVRDSL